jgi:hypothetical protein
MAQNEENQMMHLYEGGNIFGDGDIPKEAVQGIIAHVQADLPSGLKAIADIGSAGYKVSAGDMDLFLDAETVMKKFNAADEKSAKVALAEFMMAKGYKAKLSGRNVHIEVPYKTEAGPRSAQVDLMVIPDATRVADWHQHGPRGSYEDPKFKAAQIFILLNSIGKHLGLKVDAFAGNVLRRDNNEVVANNRDAAAKVLLNPKAKAADLNSVGTIMAALKTDPDREGKLAQARQDQAKGLLTLPEDVAPGTASWFRNISSQL